MALLNEKVQGQIREVFDRLEGPVKMLMFTQGDDGSATLECQMCSDTRQLVEEVAELSDKVSVDVRDFVKDAALAEQYKIDKIPAIAMLGPGDRDYGIRLYGIPSGYEFSSLIEDIVLVSSGKHDLSPETLKEIEKLDRPVHIQVYITPT